MSPHVSQVSLTPPVPPIPMSPMSPRPPCPSHVPRVPPAPCAPCPPCPPCPLPGHGRPRWAGTGRGPGRPAPRAPVTTPSPSPVTVPRHPPGDLRAAARPHGTDGTLRQDVCGCPVPGEPAALGLGGHQGPLGGARSDPPAPPG